jgi:hypothetical protein
MTKLRGVGVGLVFLLGCAVGGMAGRIAVPPASAQQMATGSRWEYFCFDATDPGRITLKANEAGAQGWEMVTGAMAMSGMLSDAAWCFKRPKL